VTLDSMMPNTDGLNCVNKNGSIHDGLVIEYGLNELYLLHEDASQHEIPGVVVSGGDVINELQIHLACYGQRFSPKGFYPEGDFIVGIENALKCIGGNNTRKGYKN